MYDNVNMNPRNWILVHTMANKHLDNRTRSPCQLCFGFDQTISTKAKFLTRPCLNLSHLNPHNHPIFWRQSTHLPHRRVWTLYGRPPWQRASTATRDTNWSDAPRPETWSSIPSNGTISVSRKYWLHWCVDIAIHFPKKRATGHFGGDPSFRLIWKQRRVHNCLRTNDVETVWLV